MQKQCFIRSFKYFDPRIRVHPRSVLFRRFSAAPRLEKPTIASLVSSQNDRADGTNLTVNGFVRSIRKHKKVAFLALGDGSTITPLQVVLHPDQAQSLATGMAVEVSGVWKQSVGRSQSFELHAEETRSLGELDPETYPLQKKYHTPEFLRTLPHLRARTVSNALLLRLRSHAIGHVTSFMASRDFIQTHPPLITSSDCEGAGEVFRVETGSPPSDAKEAERSHFFGDPKYLTVSSQLHLEALAQSVNRVWALSPTFRAERSDTSRHLSEFYMLEAEQSFSNDLEEIMSLVENLLKHVVRGITEDLSLAPELLALRKSEAEESEADDTEPAVVTAETLQSRWDGMMASSWPRISYTEAISELQTAVQQGKAKFEFPPEWSGGLQAEHERFLAGEIGGGSRPVFVTDYPRPLKPFYMSPSSDGKQTVSCFDLLVPDVCEIAGGSMREHQLQPLLDSMREHGLAKPPTGSDTEWDLGSLAWYADLRRWGSVPHGGFGIGFDRLLGYLAGVSNVRDVVTFPRWVGRCDC